jgi:hypothetical protein
VVALGGRGKSPTATQEQPTAWLRPGWRRLECCGTSGSPARHGRGGATSSAIGPAVGVARAGKLRLPGSRTTSTRQAELLQTWTRELPELGETLSPTALVAGFQGDGKPQLLIQELPLASGGEPVELDQRQQNDGGWRASPQERFARLLRETEVLLGREPVLDAKPWAAAGGCGGGQPQLPGDIRLSDLAERELTSLCVV